MALRFAPCKRTISSPASSASVNGLVHQECAKRHAQALASMPLFPKKASASSGVICFFLSMKRPRSDMVVRYWMLVAVTGPSTSGPFLRVNFSSRSPDPVGSISPRREPANIARDGLRAAR